MPEMSVELFQTLLAVGWLDGELDDSEREGILEAAAASGLAAEDLAKLRALAATRVTFADMDYDHLDAAQRLLIYACASWVAQIDDRVTRHERAGLHAMGTLLSVTPSGRASMDALVETVRAEQAGADMPDIALLRDRIAEQLGAAGT